VKNKHRAERQARAVPM